MSVALVYLHDTRGGSRSWYESLWALRNYDKGRNLRYEAAQPLALVDGFADSRNESVRLFMDRSDCEWAWLCDRDMGFPPNALERLLAVADPVSRPIAGALCFASWRGDPDGMGGFATNPMPVVLQWSDELDGGRGLTNMDLYPVDSVFRVAATGAAFLLVHRSVFEALGSDWFTPTKDPSGRDCGEDISFCLRAGRAGFPVFVHSGVKTTHHKERWLSESDYWRSFRPPPASEDTAVVVPELAPERAERFAASLVASSGLVDLYVGDGWLSTSEPWVFLTGDDVTFAPGWLDHAQHVARSFRVDVVQANGRGVLARRELAAKFPDDWAGLVRYAKDHGTFQVALGALVEVAS